MSEEGEKSRSVLVLGTLPTACVIPVEEVREVVGSGVSHSDYSHLPIAEGEGALPPKTLTLATLGLLGLAGAPERLLVLVRAPHGPYLQFAAEVVQEELQSGDLLPLPARPFADSWFSALVVQDERVIGLMLDVERLLGRAS